MIGKQLLKRSPERSFHCDSVTSFFGSFVNQAYLVGASDCPNTAHIDVPLLSEVWKLKTPQQRETIIVWVVIVPLKPLGMYKEIIR